MAEAYDEQIKRHGFTPRSLFYSDDDLHAAKMTQYAVLSHKLLHRHDKVLDVGCGYGSLVPLIPPCEYVGVDVVEPFVIEARRRYPGVRFEHVDLEQFTEMSDWVLLAGVMGSVSDPDSLITRAWALCRLGLVVDFIDASKYTGTSLNSYDMGCCLEVFLEVGSEHVEVITCPGYNWSIFLVRRHGLWLTGADRSLTHRGGILP